MLDPPDISEQTLRDALAAEYGLDDARPTFLPLGNDSEAWVYRVDTPGAPYFLKLRRALTSEVGLAVPHLLRQRGIAQVVAPIPARSGALWAAADGWTLVLAPFISGRTAASVGLSDAQWAELGALMRAVHATPLPPELERTLPRETFAPEWRDDTEALRARALSGGHDDPLDAEAAEFWRASAAAIDAVIERADTLGPRLRDSHPPHVLCHADCHTYNVLVTDAGELLLVDWDEVTVAPRERDLFFFAGGISEQLVSPRAEAAFFSAYGEGTVDPVALAYYRATWAVQDITDFAARVFGMRDVGAETRREALGALRGLFLPGEIVDLALRLEA